VSAAERAAGSRAVALDGRPLGRRGIETRRRLLEATADLLETHGVRDVRVVDIARAVGTSPATFYQYFRDVEAAVLAIAEEVGEQAAPLGELLEQPWDGAGGLDHARELVDGFMAYWDRHRAVLRTRNLAAQEGDERFRDVRNRALSPLTEAFARKVARDGPPELSPYAAAAAMVAMMERLAAFQADLGERYGTGRADVVETTARILYQTVSRPEPRDGEVSRPPGGS
jgi:AcrR family transcriptional regulator